MLRQLLHFLKRPDLAERGQALVLFAGGLVAFCGMVGLSVDVGQLVHTRTDLQKVADAAALAGSQDLPSSGTATSVANSYVFKNGGSSTSAVVAFSQAYAANDTIKVTAKRHVNYSFLRVLGLSGSDVTATASVRVGTYSGGTGVLPWGFIASNQPNNNLLQNSCYDGIGADGLPKFKQNQSCQLKAGAGENGGGDFGSLALGGTGASQYESNIRNGSTIPIKKGDQLNPQTGNAVGPTRKAVEDRLAAVSANCDTKAEALTSDGLGGYRINANCWNSPNIIVIPVVNKISNPALSTVLGFAYMFLESVKTQGGHMVITGQFINFVEELPNGIYQGFGSGPKSIKLVE